MVFATNIVHRTISILFFNQGMRLPIEDFFLFLELPFNFTRNIDHFSNKRVLYSMELLFMY